jgi:glutamate synthase domain-containing protein 1
MMKGISKDKDISGCAIAGIMSERGDRLSGEQVIRMISNMHERSNGLGGGFAAYGIYPEHKDQYAFHIMYDDHDAKKETEGILSTRCVLHGDEPIPVRKVNGIHNEPILHRYFVNAKPDELERSDLVEDDIIVEVVMTINLKVDGAFIFSSGRNMGVFKGVGYPEDIAEFYRIDEYDAYIWSGHGRFPTNTPGWWGGAHPFSILDWTVVHNGEISSYGINKRYLENFGYHCTLQTDTEVIAYLFDLLIRKHELPLEAACMAMAPPFWSQIERMPKDRKKLAGIIRTVYASALLNGPFSVLVGHSSGMIGFNDRTKLRPMVAARSGDMFYIASEDASIREVCTTPEKIWHAEAGMPIVGILKEREDAQMAYPARIPCGA